MFRYKLILSYKGTHFHGWQIQPNATSVQEELNQKISVLCGQEVNVLGAGRTDTGVHARNFVAHFDLENEFTKMTLEDFTFKLNTFLSKDIVIHKIERADDQFHARFDATSRTYKYFIHQKKDPFLLEQSWYKYGHLDIDKMNEAAQYLMGKQDFTSFSKLHTQVKTNNCDVQFIQWLEYQHQLIFTIRADRFLRNMVRAVVGTLILVGAGKIKPEDVKEIIARKDRSLAGTSVPAEGLFLWEIAYPENPQND